MTRYLINSNPEKGDGVKEGVKDKTNSRDASASKNTNKIRSANTNTRPCLPWYPFVSPTSIGGRSIRLSISPSHPFFVAKLPIFE